MIRQAKTTDFDAVKHIYLKRGYKETEYNIIETGNGDKLCYDVMVKEAT